MGKRAFVLAGIILGICFAAQAQKALAYSSATGDYP
jgi:hypothetical protein